MSERLELWEGAAVDEWARRWDLPALVVLDDVGSTNDVARELAQNGVPAGTVVMAEHQSAGRGRQGREWAAGRGQSLLFSMVLRPDDDPAGTAPGTAPLRVGAAVARALRENAGIDARVKWPNDVVISDRKLAGILCEAITTGARATVIAGVGINVLQQVSDWPDEVRESAASVAGVSRGATRSAIMTAVCAALTPLRTMPMRPLDEHELAVWSSLDALHGRRITVHGDTTIEGRAAGIDLDGALLVEAGGVLRRVTSATVRPIEPLSHATNPVR